MQLRLIFLGILFSVLLLPAKVCAQHIITGNLEDATRDEPLGFASVIALNPSDSAFLSGTLADSVGGFSLSVPRERTTVLVQVTHIGYAETFRLVELQPGDTTRMELPLRLEASENAIEAVEITARMEQIEFLADGFEFNADQNLTSNIGSVLDLLRNTPGVTVDQDGNVSIRGASSTQILINGRISSQTNDLDQIPALSVKSIRVITNPGARYDAEGEGGIINIKLRKNRTRGFNGTATAGVGSRLRSNAGLRLNYNPGSFNIFGNASIYRGLRRQTGNSFRIQFPEEVTTLDQDILSNRNRLGGRATLGADFFLDSLTTLSAEANLTGGQREGEEENEGYFYNIDGQLVDRNIRESESDGLRIGPEFALAMTREFNNPGQELFVSANYSQQEYNRQRDMDFAYLTNEGVRDPARSGQQRTKNEALRRYIIAQIDYSHPFGENWTAETGYRYTYRQIDTDFLLEDYNPALNSWETNLGATNTFNYQEGIHALYGNVRTQLGQLKISGGLRAEATSIQTELVQTGEKNPRDYISLFPSSQLQYLFSKQNSLRFTYSRRIDRPRGYFLNPFVDLADSLNIRQGNPDLNPEFINSFEFGHNWTGKALQLSSTLFFRRVEGVVDWVVRQEGNVIRLGPENQNDRTTYGLAFDGAVYPAEWFDFNFSLSGFRSEISANESLEGTGNSGWVALTRLTTNFRLPWGLRLQLIGIYNSPEIDLQGEDWEFLSTSASLQKSFLRDRLSLTVNVEDVLYTEARGYTFETEEFYQEYNYRADTRRVFFNVQYTFGQRPEQRRRVRRDYRQGR